VIAPELTGRDTVAGQLRDACAEAVARLVATQPEVITVAGPGRITRRWAPDSRLDLSVFAPMLGQAGDPALPPSLGLGTLLLDQTGYQGRRVLQAVSEDEPTARCARLGAALSRSAGRVGLLAMGDGSARRSPQAPGYFDDRSAVFDAQTESALRQGDLDALLAISPTLARELMATGRPAWQVLAGAMHPAKPAAEILYSGDPLGVAYVVAFLAARAEEQPARTGPPK
jgi:hypothetical protein